MARPQAFDQQQVLQNAMELFWRQGYASTSVRDLTEATKLQPGSLYGAFKSKRQLFLNALDLYFSGLLAAVSEMRQGQQPPLERIQQFFQALLQQTQQDADHKGCLLVNTLLEIPTDDAEINQRVSQMLQQVEKSFCEVLLEAQQRGELAQDKDPARLARLLINGIFGLRVYNRMQPSAETLQTTVDDLLSILR